MWAKLVDMILSKVILNALNYLADYIPEMLNEWKRKKDREVAQREAQRKYDEVAKNPNKTTEDEAKAYEDYINSGR